MPILQLLKQFCLNSPPPSPSPSSLHTVNIHVLDTATLEDIDKDRNYSIFLGIKCKFYDIELRSNVPGIIFHLCTLLLSYSHNLTLIEEEIQRTTQEYLRNIPVLCTEQEAFQYLSGNLLLYLAVC